VRRPVVSHIAIGTLALATATCTSRLQASAQEAAGGSAPPPARCTSPVVADINSKVRARLCDDLLSCLRTTPALPFAWPDAQGKLVFFAYETEPRLENSMSTEVTGPTHRVVVALASGEPLVEKLRAPRVLGVERDDKPGPRRGEMPRAEQALVDVVAGCRTPDDAAADLRPYLAWLERAYVTAADLEKRAGPFIAWLKTHRPERR